MSIALLPIEHPFTSAALLARVPTGGNRMALAQHKKVQAAGTELCAVEGRAPVFFNASQPGRMLQSTRVTGLTESRLLLGLAVKP